MPQRIKDGGKNAASLSGKTNPGQFASKQSKERQGASNALVQRALMKPSLEARLEEMGHQGEYANQVNSHFALNAMAVEVKNNVPGAKTMVFDIEDPEAPFLDSVELEDSTVSYYEPKGDEIDSVDWEFSQSYSAFGRGGLRYARIDVDSALVVPEYLTDDAYLDAPEVPTDAAEKTISYAHTLAAVEYHERAARFHEEGPDFIARELQRAQVRRAELLAAGVTR